MKTLPNNLHTRPGPLDDWPRIHGVYVYSSIVDVGLQPTKFYQIEGWFIPIRLHETHSKPLTLTPESNRLELIILKV
jgi:hypothetical protein